MPYRIFETLTNCLRSVLVLVTLQHQQGMQHTGNDTFDTHYQDRGSMDTEKRMESGFANFLHPPSQQDNTSRAKSARSSAGGELTTSRYGREHTQKANSPISSGYQMIVSSSHFLYWLYPLLAVKVDPKFLCTVWGNWNNSGWFVYYGLQGSIYCTPSACPQDLVPRVETWQCHDWIRIF